MVAAGVVVGVDIGTTSTKVGAFDADGGVLATAEEGYALEQPQPGWAVQDPDAILRAVQRSVASVVADVGADRVAGLSYSVAMHTLIGLDDAGAPLTPSVTWGDRRASAQAERLRASPLGEPLYRRTGTPVHPMSPLTKLAWYAETDPELVARVRHWVGVKEYVLNRLCGGELVADMSVASATGMLDVAGLSWDADALAAARVDADRLPTLVPVTHVLDGLTGTAAAATGLPAATPVVVGATDGPLSNLGLGAVRPGVVAVSIGTSGAVRTMVGAPTLDARGALFCYAFLPDRWLLGGATNNGGVVLQWVNDVLAPELGDSAEEELLGLAATVPAGSDGLLMLPYLLGERSPHWSSLPRGAYVGLTRAHGRGHLVRAAVEGVCLQVELLLGTLRSAGLTVEEVRATGGFARSPFWRQLLADVLGVGVGYAGASYGTSLGAAMLGRVALGLADSVDDLARGVSIDHVHRPDASAVGIYERLSPLFAGLYDTLLPTFHALSTGGQLQPLVDPHPSQT